MLLVARIKNANCFILGAYCIAVRIMTKAILRCFVTYKCSARSSSIECLVATQTLHTCPAIFSNVMLLQTMSPTVFYVVLLGTVLLNLLYISAGVLAISLLLHR